MKTPDNINDRYKFIQVPANSFPAGVECFVVGEDGRRFSVLQNDDAVTVLENAGEGIDAEGWALIAPFGSFPKTRVYREGNQVREQKFIQVLDNDSADALLARENSLFGRIKRAVVGLTIWKGHGDLNDHDKTALGNSQEKTKLGTVDQIRKSARGIEAHFILDNDGEAAVAAGWKFPSVLWRVAHAGTQGDAIIGTPFKLLSVALTQFPNISGVDSLANARVNEPAASGGAGRTGLPSEVVTETKEPKNTMKPLIIGWLAAQGVVLANDAADQVVFEAFNKKMLETNTTLSTLGNEKTTLTTKTGTLEADLATTKTKLTETATALGNEQTARKAERTRAATLAVDLAIQKGKRTIAQREAEISTLENSADFDAAVKALIEGAPVVKIAGQDTQSGKQQSALSNEQTALQNDYNKAFQAELIATGQNPTKAHQNVMTLPKYAGLAAKLVPQKG